MKAFVALSITAFLCALEVACLEPITTGLAVGGAAVLGGLSKLSWCHFRECCTTPWIQHNVTRFEESFDKYVFGQHLVRDVVSKALKSHLRRIHAGQQSTSSTRPRDGPEKALVLTFHGLTGSGKNYVTKFIAESLYSQGMKSQFVHHIIGPYHFPKSQHSDIHALHLQDWIKTNVSACSQSLFILDEVDKIDGKIINAVKPFIDTHEVIDGVDYRKSIFVLLSNTGKGKIMEKTLSLWNEGVKREDITLSDLQHVTQQGAFNEVGGLKNSEIIIHHLVDHFVPFLPLERSHVKQCAVFDLVHALMAENIECDDHSDMIEEIMSNMVFKPDDSKLYSSTGCKRVSTYVNLVVEALIDKLDGGQKATEANCRRKKS